MMTIQRTPVLDSTARILTAGQDDLSMLHEYAIGDGHPIDIASRRDELRQVKKFLTGHRSVIMEIGCSSGLFCTGLSQVFSGGSCHRRGCC